MVDAVTENTTQDTDASVDHKSAVHLMIEAQLNTEHHQREADKNNLTSQSQLPDLEKNFDNLAEKHPEYANKNSIDMIQQYEQEFNESFQIGSQMQCDNPNVVNDLYNEKYKKTTEEDDTKEKSVASWVMNLLMKGSNDEEDKELHFESEEQFKEFLAELAEKEVSFEITDANGKMECYSNGDGKLKHADNNAVVEPHETLRSSPMSRDDFLEQEAYKAEQIEAATQASRTMDMTPRPGR